MAAAAATTVFVQAGETVDLLVWRALGRVAGAVEAVLGANPGLADLGIHPPPGTAVVIPASADRAAAAALVQLWD